MLNHKTALITGGSEGIGLACAMKLHGSGYSVCLISRSEDKLTAAVKAIRDTQTPQTTPVNNSTPGLGTGNIFAIPCDVTRSDSVHEAVKEASQKLGSIGVLLNCAGCSMHAPSPFEEVDEEEYLRIMHTNTDGLFWVTQAVLPIMKKQEAGYIINILSTASHAAGAGNAPYSSSKYAAKAMTDTLIEECRGTGIRISSISPGPVATTIWSHKTTPPDSSLMARMLRPQDIADIAAYLLSTPANVHIRDLLVTPWNY